MLASLPTLCSHIYLQFLSLFTSTDVSKCELEIKEYIEDYILRSTQNATLDWLVFDDRAKTKLAILAFLYCGKIVKNSTTRAM